MEENSIFIKHDVSPYIYEDSLKDDWRSICNQYLLKFCDRHQYHYDPDMWVANNPGTIICINDMFVSMEDIRFDVDNNIDIDCFDSWYWKSVDVYELTGQKYMNYHSFCSGAPDIYTEEKLKSIREAKVNVEKAKEALQFEIDRLTKEDFKQKLISNKI